MTGNGGSFCIVAFVQTHAVQRISDITQNLPFRKIGKKLVQIERIGVFQPIGNGQFSGMGSRCGCLCDVHLRVEGECRVRLRQHIPIRRAACQGQLR